MQWETAVLWQSVQERYRLWNLLAGLLAFVIFSVPCAIVMVWALRQNAPGTPDMSCGGAAGILKKMRKLYTSRPVL